MNYVKPIYKLKYTYKDKLFLKIFFYFIPRVHYYFFNFPPTGE